MPSRRTFLKASAALASAALLPRRLSAQMARGTTPEMAAASAAYPPPLAPGPVQPSWDSIAANYADPAWFRDAKFGIFMHWGLYSVPAHGSEWYVRYMYSNPDFIKWHTEHYGPPDKFGYKDFIPLFTCAKWDPDAWATLFKNAGAKYICPTAEHHDGWANWNSDLTDWCAGKMGPKRDLIGDLAAAVRKQGLKFGASSHRMNHYDFIQPAPGLATDLNDPKTDDFYWVMNHSPKRYEQFMATWVARSCELIDKYQLDMLWYDMGGNSRIQDPIKTKVAAYYLNRAKGWNKQVALSSKGDAFPAASIMDYEREGRAPMELVDFPWQADDPITDKFGYVEGQKVFPADGFIRKIVENTSKNGNLLLNISPKADGTIPQEQQDVLLAIGKWLQVNGEAIYASRPFTHYGEGPAADAAAAYMKDLRAKGPFTARTNEANQGNADLAGGGMPKKGYTPADFRFTTNANTLYAIAMAWPENRSLTIASLAPDKAPKGQIQKVELLGHDAPLPFNASPQGLQVTLPDQKPCDTAYSLKITGLTL